ncbi:ribonucleases P/MRP protein subunit POP1-like [Physella acuta]|uniref:ribonucleases P/MRP protein subunit POP1-like n=1 Tax=Physella acuta TaxID=109671 RepID=UPI0027DBD9BC|nr:ribonucleases P/MRP protein subunit POP1-like [Physella acuta]
MTSVIRSNNGKQARKRVRPSTTSEVDNKTFDVDGSTPAKHNRLVKLTESKMQEKIVYDINVEHFVESRATEIQALTQAVKDVGGNHLAFQKLPRHMRRRAMSHNIKRVPKRLHSIVKLELEKTKAPGKRPSRKFRRRPSNLLSEYERRKRRIGWLETHIWHAKRFKMVEKWGCKLAVHPNDKSVRACYRAVNNHCLMQDVSFEKYIEITGLREKILTALSHLCSEKTGPTFASKLTSLGTRHASLVLYKHDMYPYGAIGPVSYFWRPALPPHTTQSTIWVGCHLSIFSQVFDEITKCFDLGSSEVMAEGSSDVVVRPLNNELVKLRLFGPASNVVLSETLQLSPMISQCTDSPAQGNVDFWWKSYYSSSLQQESFKQQADVWRDLQCSTPGQVPANSILGLTVRDPRLLLPPKRSKVTLINSGSAVNSLSTPAFTEQVADSPLWDPVIREKVKATKMAEHQLNEMRSKHLIPGTPLDLGERESLIPVILMHRPGSITTGARAGYAGGWDLLVPSGWAMAFWVALVYRGARTGGLREARSVALQARMLAEPYDFPDTPSGQEELTGELLALELKHNRRPPAKRPNYTKLGITSPFRFEFGKLVKEWQEKYAVSPQRNNYFVLRERRITRFLNDALTDTLNFFRQLKKSVGKDAKNVRTLLSKKFGESCLPVCSSALVPVYLMIQCRGVPAINGQICVPSEEDLTALARDKTYSGPLEPQHKDPFLAQRRAERLLRLKLRKKKRRGKKSAGVVGVAGLTGQVSTGPAQATSTGQASTGPAQATSTGQVSTGPAQATSTGQVSTGPAQATSTGQASTGPALATSAGPGQLISAGQTPVIGLAQATSTDRVTGSGPEVTQADVRLLSHTSRPVMGFITGGDFHLGIGQGSGLGFCSVLAVLDLLEKQQGRRHCTVLVRNPTSLQYRFAAMSLVM